MSTDKIQKAVELVEASFMTLDEAAKHCELSQVYFRRIVEGEETEDVKLKTLIFGKQVILRETVEQILVGVLGARRERAQKAQAKLEEKASKNSEPKGPTLLDLKLEARDLQVPVGRKNKAELIAALEAKRLETATAIDAEIEANAAISDAKLIEEVAAEVDEDELVSGDAFAQNEELHEVMTR